MRTFLPVASVIAVAGTACGSQAFAETRSLTFYNIHTKEKKTVTYKRDGTFDPEGMKEINHVMRDWRRDEPTKMDPELIDTIWEIYQDVGSSEPIHLISGFRSQKTNSMLRRTRGGQARKSQHILGKAADLHFPDVPIKKLRNSALVKQVGGVGYYPKSGIPFVHVDTGRVRHWPRIGRQELALLFPDGKTKHVPADGRPLTRKDGQVALAKLGKKVDTFIEKKSKVKLPPKMMMAGFTPPSLGWQKADPTVTAAIPKEKTPLPPKEETRTAAVPAPAPEPARIEAPEAKPQIALSQVEDAEHPEELVYENGSVVELMSEVAVAADLHLGLAAAPGEDEDGYLLRDPETAYSASLASGLGYSYTLTAVTFGSQDASGDRPFRTASRQ